MIEVHPPEHHIFTWKQFFLHMATICLGLLIAIGLEQTVEWLHRRSERAELREQLKEESEQIVKDARGQRAYLKQRAIRTRLRRDALSEAAQGGSLPQPLPAFSEPDVEMVNDPVWQAVKTGNAASLLTREEVVARGELDALCAASREANHDGNAFNRNANAFATRLGGTGIYRSDLSHASKQDLLTAAEDLALVSNALGSEMIYNSAALAVAELTARGEYRLPVLYAAEHEEQRRMSSEVTEGIKTAKKAELKQQAAPPSTPHQ